MRKALFLTSFLTAILAAVAVYFDWAVSFPLVGHSDGSLSINPWEDRIFDLGLLLCLATIGLAAFGRGRVKWFVMGAGMLLFAFSLIGYLQNHV